MNDKDNSLQITWCNRVWLPYLNQHNVLSYFADKNNPFYDHTCNNEHLKMRGLHIRELEKMKGIEYILLQAQEPILYVIRKQQRNSPTHVVPLANYYIIAGVIYQAPDLKSILESKLLTTIHCLQSAFEECFNYARFHPSVDYQWSFDRDPFNLTGIAKNTGRESSETSDNSSNNKKDIFQRKEILITEASDSMRMKYRHSVDALIRDLYFKFPPPEQKIPAIQQGESSSGPGQTSSNNENNQNGLNQQTNGTSKQTTSTIDKQNGVTNVTTTHIKMETDDDDIVGPGVSQNIRGNQKSGGTLSMTKSIMGSGPQSSKKPKLN